jgi:hypothetical protein
LLPSAETLASFGPVVAIGALLSFT